MMDSFNQPEPIPTQTDRSVSVTDALIQALNERRQAGIKKYGTELLTFNGRDALIDLLQEMFDAAAYAFQRVKELEVENKAYSVKIIGDAWDACGPSSDSILSLQNFWNKHAEWSQATFGSDAERGPAGPLKHLEKEAVEARENPSDISEFADIGLLWFDATRRAKHTLPQLIEAMWVKLDKNKRREWAKPSADEPVYHVKTQSPNLVEALHDDIKTTSEKARELTKKLLHDAFITPKYPNVTKAGLSVVGPHEQVPSSDWLPWVAKHKEQVDAYNAGPHGPIRWTQIDGGPYACDVERLLADLPQLD